MNKATNNELEKIDTVILCGGLGTRLRSTIGETQKTMAKVGEEPFMNKVLKYLKDQGLRRFILAVGFQAEQVEAYYSENNLGLSIEFSREISPLGTGGAIKNAEKFVRSDRFFAMNGDCFCVLNYRDFYDFHNENKNCATLSVAKMPDTRDYGTILMSGENVIRGFEEKKNVPGGGYVNIGAYCFDREIFGMMPADKFSIERDFFPLLPPKLGPRFQGYVVDREFLDIGTPERYSKAAQTIRKVSQK